MEFSLLFSSPNLNGCKIQISSLLFSMVLAYVFLHRWNQRNAKGPKSWPYLGVLVELLINYHRMHDWLTDYFVASKTIKVPLPFTTLTYISGPANVEHVLKTNFSNYPKGEAFHAYMEELLGDGIFNTDGEMWKQQRKVSSFEFASRNLRNYSTTVFREYGLILSGILHQASICGKGIDMQELLLRMTLDSICKVGFGVEIGTLSHDLPDNHFAKAFEYATSNVSYRFINPLWRLKKFLNVGSEALFVQSIQAIDEFTYDLIHKRKAELREVAKSNDNSSGNNKVKHDILSRFIELSENPDNNLTDKSIRDVIINFILAGRDTTASTLSWFIYMMVMNPNVAEKVYQELITFEEHEAKEVNAYDPGEEPESLPERLTQFASLLNYDSLGKLSYLHAAITETLRLYPAVPQDPKGVLEDDILPDGIKVRAGGMVVYVPYAAGPRTCLGKGSTYLQIKMTLAILCKFFNFDLIPNHHVKYRMTTTLNMEHGLKLTVTTRQS